MTKSELGRSRTFASLRFAGDGLDPDRMTEVLRTAPTLAYRKGEVFKRSRGHQVRGRTNLWLLSSKGRVQSLELSDHLKFLLGILFPGASDEVAERLRGMLRDGRIKADVSCFWAGLPGMMPPAVPEQVRAALASLPAEIETDFVTDCDAEGDGGSAD